MKGVSLTIDGRAVRARKGDTVLWAALDNGIYIPNLCSIRESAEPFAGSVRYQPCCSSQSVPFQCARSVKR